MSETKNNSNKKKKYKKRSNCQKENTNNNSKAKKGSSCINSQPSQSSSSKNTRSKLCCFNSIDYIVLASTLAIALSEELSSTDLGILSTFFAVLSDELALIQSVNNCNNNNNNPVFTPPIADIAVTSSRNESNKGKKNIKKKK